MYFMIFVYVQGQTGESCGDLGWQLYQCEREGYSTIKGTLCTVNVVLLALRTQMMNQRITLHGMFKC